MEKRQSLLTVVLGKLDRYMSENEIKYYLILYTKLPNTIHKNKFKMD